MQTSKLHKTSLTVISTVLLSVLAIYGNYLHLSLFFGVDFIFGSIAALIALRLSGLKVGVAVALIAGAYTYHRWGHPYAMITFGLEAFIVGILLKRRISSLVLADILYWIILGMPLVWFFYHHVLGMNDSQATLILLKQPINGIANAIIATYILFLIPKHFYQAKQSNVQSHIYLKELLFTTLLAVSLLITLLLITYQSHTAKPQYESNLNNEMKLYLDFIEYRVIDNSGSINYQVITGDHHLYTHHRNIILLSNDTRKILATSLPKNISEAFINSGTTQNLQNGLKLWMPERGELPLMLWWKKTYYFIEQPLDSLPGANLIVLQNSQPIIEKLQKNVVQEFMLLFGMMLASGLIAYYISTLLTNPIIKLTESTKNVPDKLKTGMHIEWPRSAISELNQLSSQAQLMSESIRETFNDANLRSSAIIEASVDAIITINDKDIVESFNTAAERMFGYPRGEIIGTNIKRLMPEPYQAHHDGYIKNFAADNSRRPFAGNRRELQALRKNGSTFPIELSLTTVYLQNQILYTGILTDITERKANERLKHEFISTVSHELRTPLTSIQGALKLIQARQATASAEESQTMMALAERNAHRLAELINDLLDFEKLDSDGIRYNYQNIDLNELLGTLIENNSPMATQAGVHLLQADSCRGRIKADPARLIQVLSNLISNAIKFSRPDSSINLGCIVEPEQIKIYVQDHGEGIADEFKQRIFQRFSQADGSDTKRIQRGTGLGLAISRRMTEDMGGCITFESQLGVGSTFYVIFPPERD